MYKKYFKRLFDFIISLIAIIILSPIYLIVGILVRLKLGSPIIFCQKRPGKNEKIFKMYKFRTMTEEKDENGLLLPDEIRLTKFGKQLRATSLDELPEFINILKGDMSIVGPRPQLVKDMAFMTSEQRVRQSARQGLTGLAQINGRNNITWEEKIEYDLEYLSRVSFLTDFRIIILTFSKVLKKENVYTAGLETAEDYGDYLLRTKKITKEEYNEIVATLREIP